MKKVLLTSAVVLTAFGAYTVANAEDVTVPSLTANTSTYIQSLKQKIDMVKSGYPYKKADGTTDPAYTADAANLKTAVEDVQKAVAKLTKLQDEYKTLYTKYHNALNERAEREAKRGELEKAVAEARTKLYNLTFDKESSKIANTALKTEYEDLANINLDTNTEKYAVNAAGYDKTLASAQAAVSAAEQDLNTAKQDLVTYKANNVTQLNDDYESMVTQKTAEVNRKQLALDEAKKELSKRSARLETLETDLVLAMDVDYATGYAIRQAGKELRAANKAEADNLGKLASVIKLVTDPATGLQKRLTDLKGDGTVANRGEISAAEAELNAKIGAANAAFATVDGHIAAINGDAAKRLGLKFEFEKLADAVKAVLATETPDVPATPATPAKAAWIQSGSSWWYKHADGSYTTNGWEKINGTWYYFDQAGWMVTGWVKDNGTWYYLKDNGAMATGWVKDNGTWYYLNNNGSMATGWYKVGEKWYYSYASGALAVNTTVDGYTVNGNGEWVK